MKEFWFWVKEPFYWLKRRLDEIIQFHDESIALGVSFALIAIFVLTAKGILWVIEVAMGQRVEVSRGLIARRTLR